MSEKETIERLVAEAQNGNHQAFGQLYDVLVDRIYAYVLRKVGNKMDAQDLTAETFKRAWASLSRYRQNSFKAYLYAIARNTTLDFFRQQKRAQQVGFDPATLGESKPFEAELIREQEREKLAAALRKLPEHYAEVITLRFLEELSTQETAAVMGRTSVSVRVIQYRALRRLRRLLKHKL